MQTDSSLISIIIPTYNRAQLIGETLDSIFAQSYPNWECLVIDDGSTDNTSIILSEYLDKDSRFQYHQRPDAYIAGGNGARNYGFTLSKGAYVMWFDSDDIMLPDYLSLQVANCIKHQYMFSICKFSTFSETAGVLVKETKLYHDRLLEDFITMRIKINPQAVLFSRTILNDITYDESLCKAQDLDFIYRVLLHHKDAGGILDQVLVKVRIHDNRITSAYKNFELKPLLSSVEVKWRIVRDTQYIVDIKTFESVKHIFISELKLVVYRGNFVTFIRYLNRLLQIKAINGKEYFAIAIKYISKTPYKLPQGIVKRSSFLKKSKKAFKHIKT